MSKPVKQDYIEPPKLYQGGPYDHDHVRHLYMSSEFIDWTRFAESQHWDPLFSRRQFKVASWQAEKRKAIAEKEAEILAATLFDYKWKWHKDVVKTLHEFPAANDTMLTLIRLKQNELLKLYKEFSEIKDEKLKARHPWNRVSSSELNQLATALKQVTESKHKSLLLNNWSVQLAEDHSTIQEEGTTDKTLVFQLKGQSEMTVQDVQRLLDEYIDKPIDVTPETQGED